MDMITQEEYELLKRIIQEYEAQNNRDDDDDYEDPDEIEERRWQQFVDKAVSCTCGAWRLTKNKGHLIQVADCCCGA